MPGYTENARTALMLGSNLNLGVNVGTPWSCEGCPRMKEKVDRANKLLGELRHLSVSQAVQNIIIPAESVREGDDAKALEELLETHQWIEDRYFTCRDESVGIFSDGEQVGMYCADANEDIYFNQTSEEGLE